MGLVGADEKLLRDRLARISRWIEGHRRQIAIEEKSLASCLDEVGEINAELTRRTKDTDPLDKPPRGIPLADLTALCDHINEKTGAKQ